jgi:hypothetical protein
LAAVWITPSYWVSLHASREFFMSTALFVGGGGSSGGSTRGSFVSSLVIVHTAPWSSC